ncbi:MAG: hypothetical protein EXQ96_03480 [Alphaproteobacteria bacterium]|nr:hypothetical protein [Alphaproteobacteria bacterium]
MSAAPEPVPESGGAGTSQFFEFQHKVFKVDGAYFALATDSKIPNFYVPLGELRGAVTMKSLRVEFDIDPESPDGRMLDAVEKGLRFVRQIRPGDSIPRELLDGTASWTVEDRHVLAAHRHLTVQLASWLSGNESVVVDQSGLEQIADDPKIRQQVRTAFGEIAERLGLRRSNAQQVVTRIENLARELAYVEALRELAGQVQAIHDTLTRVQAAHRRDRALIEDTLRVQSLLSKPIAALGEVLQAVDGATAQILVVLQRLDQTIATIRARRDDLHCMLTAWNELLPRWRELDAADTDAVQHLVKATYRFAAARFLQTQDWTLKNKARPR